MVNTYGLLWLNTSLNLKIVGMPVKGVYFFKISYFRYLLKALELWGQKNLR
jgi:hypothetical protein